MLIRDEVGEVVSRYCPSCKVVKSITEFRKGCVRNRPNQYQPYCNNCTKIKVAAYQRAHPRKRVRTHEQYRKRNLKEKYGITLQDYERLFTGQGSVCCICGNAESGNPYGVLEVEHNGVTGKVRGLVCHPCNNAIMWYESWSKYPYAEKVIDYLKRDI